MAFTELMSVVVAFLGGYLLFNTRNFGPNNTVNVDIQELNINGSRIALKVKSGAELRGYIQYPLSEDVSRVRGSENKLSLQYKDCTLRIRHESFSKTPCYDIEWVGDYRDTGQFQDCYELGTSHWYGGFQHVRQPWPLEKLNMDQTPYVSTDLFYHGMSIGGVNERLLFNSDGFGVYIPDEVPLYISINSSGDGQVCLSAHRGQYPYLETPGRLSLKYTICHADNVRTVREFLLNKYFSKPENIPDETLFQKPIWCTWAQYNRNINESSVMDYANLILKNGFTHSQIEIDDEWTPFYGDLVFSKKKFPNAANTIQKLNKLGFRITLWLHPFMELNSTSFVEGAKKGYLIKTRGDRLPALVRWWNGEMAGKLDVTNSAAVDWFLNKLWILKRDFHISSFKFDAGESFFLPRNYVTKEPLRSPEEFAKLWANIAYRADTDIRHQEVRVAWRTQNLPIFVRMFDRSSSWDDVAGIKTLIPTVLTFGLLGYPFVLADMVGGNAYSDLVEFKGGAYPERELFIRWMEVNAFFPTIQYSIAPWIYDAEVIKLCKYYTELHAQYSDLMISLAKQSIKTGEPIIRPIWWNSPKDQTALVIDSEFLVGDSLLVAPVLDKGSNSRDIYLPVGEWKDMLKGGTEVGPKWIKNYKAELSELPYFTLV